jgi:uncharacterized protein DUF4159
MAVLHRARASRWGLLVAAFVLTTAGYTFAQFGRGGFFNYPIRSAPSPFPDRNFVVCRLMYTSVRREPSGGGWRTDYPYGEINLTIRFSELTKAPVSRSGQREPNHYVVRLTDDELFQCPFSMASDVGTIGLTQEEADRLRLYLLKGGFLWVDDFWGTLAWEQWTHEFSKVLPPEQFPIEDAPLDDPIFQSQFIVQRVPQITNIQFWRATRGEQTSERGAESAVPHFRVVRDSHRRIMVVMTHDTDIADSWEREGEDPAFFYQFSPDGYAVGVNVLLHAMTH